MSYRRERYVPKGGPDGGDGGRGGNVVLVGDTALSTLEGFRHRRLYKAGHGGQGLGNLKHGKKGEDLELKVPLGTAGFIAKEDGSAAGRLGEVMVEGQRLMVASGGKGGRGNKHFTTAVHQAPRFAEKGAKGEERALRLELRLLADAGMVGLPNAGKSTLLAQATSARPKIGDYPFTTLEPQVGIVKVGYERFALADMPGLIAGAAGGTGLGEEFLRYIQRTAVLLHVLDGSREDPLEDVVQTNAEMGAFDQELLKKPQLLVVNKVDLPAVRECEGDLRRRLGVLNCRIHFVSAETGQGVQALMRQTFEAIHQARRGERGRPTPSFEVFRPLEEHDYRIRKVGRRFVLEGSGAPELVVPRDTTPEDYAGILRERLRRTRWKRLIERAGVGAGDVIEVGGVDIEW